jgi:hypothetical protein
MIASALRFDRASSCFLFDGACIGPGAMAEQVGRSLSVPVRPMPGDPAWSFVRTDGRAIDAFVAFFEGVAHSGCFWVSVPGDGWEDHDRAERQRRNRHEHLMNALFGSARFEDDAIRVELIRDPRSGLERIDFRILADTI